MSTQLIKSKNICLQRDFSESTRLRLSSFFGFSGDEKLLCAVWFSPHRRDGFIITEKKLYWKIRLGESVKRGEIQTDGRPDIEFDFSTYILPEKSFSSSSEKSMAEECSRLEIKAGELIEDFYISGLTEEKGKILCDLLKYACTQKRVPKNDLNGFIKLIEPNIIQSSLDSIVNTRDKLARNILDKIAETKNAFKKQKEETAEAESEQTYDESEESHSEIEPNLENPTEENTSTSGESAIVTNFFKLTSLNILDVLASLVFIAAAIVALKPQLMAGFQFDSSYPAWRLFCNFGDKFFSISVEKTYTSSILSMRNLFVGLALPVYFIFKTVVCTFSNTSTKKIIPFLLTVMMLVICYIIREHIFIFLLLSLLTYLCFELSCGSTSRAIKIKLCVTIILALIIYVAVHVCISPELRRAIAGIGYNLSVIGNKLSIPVR